MRWLYNEFTKLTTLCIMVTQWAVHYEDIVDRFSSIFGLKKIVERRKNQMDIGKYLKLIPLLEKLATDLEAAASSPQDQAVVADIKALIADISSTPSPAAPPTGQI
jgi:hypothetical protein